MPSLFSFLPVQRTTQPSDSSAPTTATAAAVIASARHRMVNEGAGYAKAAAPRSPNPQISGNRDPGQTQLRWLAGRNKCNQFVGDVLYAAGVKTPTFRMQDGSLHYQNAERWPNHAEAFRKVPAAGAQPGDLVVIDYPDQSGENGAHIEIVSRRAAEGSVFTIGARAGGVAERESSRWFRAGAVGVTALRLR